MTEKRFGMIKTDTYELYVPVDEKKVYIFPSFEDELDCMRFVNALNDLEEKHRENGKIASNLLKENEQLRKEKECNKQVFTKKRLHELLQQTQKENDHIKQTIKTMMENERTELGQSVLRQLLEAIQ